jgi:hypothetical protein
MATAYQMLNFAQNQPAGTGHGFYKTHASLHAISGTISTWAAGDTIAVGYLPRQAIVVGCVLKAASQLDSNGSPTLAFDVGVVGTPQLFKAAITDVGHAAGASTDIGTGISASGYLYQNTSGAKQEVIITVHTAAATPVAGTIEIDIEYYVEDVVGSNP